MGWASAMAVGYSAATGAAVAVAPTSGAVLDPIGDVISEGEGMSVATGAAIPSLAAASSANGSNKTAPPPHNHNQNSGQHSSPPLCCPYHCLLLLNLASSRLPSLSWLTPLVISVEKPLARPALAVLGCARRGPVQPGAYAGGGGLSGAGRKSPCARGRLRLLVLSRPWA